MAKKKTGIMRDIKSKLMVAICMLLVSSIMMVSSTYAWFTLSTAPEVTGITTSVGANGNLEMALLPKAGHSVLNAITSGTGDSTKNIEAKNITWGNLVDLSDTTVYGMDKIKLFPSALNVGEDGKISTAALLKTPTYSADGRVDTLLANTVTAYYDSTETTFIQNEDYGVRAVGTASGMTDRQLDYRNARAAANTAAAQAKNTASQSLNNNGSALANVAIKHGISADGSDVYTQTDVASLQAIVNDLLGTETTTGALEYIESAYMQSILAYAASQASGEADTVWSAVKGAVEASGATLATVTNALTSNGVELPAALTTAISKYEATLAAVEEANTKLTALASETEVTWGEISPALHLLASTDNMEVNGIKASEIRQADNMSTLVNSVASGGLIITMRTGGGVYADIADQCGDYTASVTINEVTYNNLTLKNMTARMKTVTSQNPTYLDAIVTAVGSAGAPASGDATAKPITDMYGYVIDLAFRTNATDSNLLLQVAPADRIYSDNTNENTMGGGSSMTFAATTTDFSNDQVKALMKAIRIVFFKPEDGTILATAKLDVDNSAIGADGITANISLYTAAGSTSYIYTADENGTYKPVITYSLIAEGETVAEKYALNEGVYTRDDVNGTYKAEITGYDEILEGDTYTGTKYTRAEVTNTTETLIDDIALMALPQGQPSAMSVLVYLDGENVSNKDVAAGAATSMTGSMNLQFASSANLIPMEYAALHIPSGQAPAETTTVPAAVTSVAP